MSSARIVFKHRSPSPLYAFLRDSSSAPVKSDHRALIVSRGSN